MRRSVVALLGALALLAAQPLVTSPSPAYAVGGCATPRYVTRDPEGTWNDGDYLVANDMWNASSYRMSQRLVACTYRHWHVDVTADNSRHDGAVKTYPNVHRDFVNWATGAQPKLRTFTSIRSSFRALTPAKGIYDAAYDVWLDGLRREIMIWTVNRGQRPAGHLVRRHISVGGDVWNIWATKGNYYVAFVAVRPLTHGAFDIKAMLDWLRARKRIRGVARLAQICFGFEIVSTDATPAAFRVSRFAIEATRIHRKHRK